MRKRKQLRMRNERGKSFEELVVTERTIMTTVECGDKWAREESHEVVTNSYSSVRFPSGSDESISVHYEERDSRR